MPKKPSLAETHPEIAAQWHPNKNGSLTPYQVTIGSGKRVYWKCSAAADHEWETRITDRKGAGCPCCIGRKAVLSNCLATTHPEIAAQWHPTKNCSLTPYQVTIGRNTKVYWKCSVADDHEWEARVSDRKGAGCPCCAGQKTVLSNCLATTHPEIAAQWHPTKNGTLTPYQVILGSEKKIYWKCSAADDHEWKTRVVDRIKRGCPCCVGQKTVLSNCLATTHPEIAAQWHPTKNGTLTPYQVILGSEKKIYWKCSKNKDHVWVARVKARKITGCPICDESKGEKSITLYFQQNNITHVSQKRFKTSEIKRSKFDFAIKHFEFTGLIEYQGMQHFVPSHFGSKEQYAKEKNLIKNIRQDDKKFQFCLNHNIPLLIIPYWDKDRIPEILDDVLNGKEPIFTEPPKIVKKNATMRQKIRDHLGIKEPEVLCGLMKGKNV